MEISNVITGGIMIKEREYARKLSVRRNNVG